jgi:hypothetical protein
MRMPFLGRAPRERKGAMTATRTAKGQRILDRVGPAVITGIGLRLANYGTDFLMDRLGTSASKTILSQVTIGILSALAVYFLLSPSRESKFLRARRSESS